MSNQQGLLYAAGEDTLIYSAAKKVLTAFEKDTRNRWIFFGFLTIVFVVGILFLIGNIIGFFLYLIAVYFMFQKFQEADVHSLRGRKLVYHLTLDKKHKIAIFKITALVHRGEITLPWQELGEFYIHQEERNDREIFCLQIKHQSKKLLFDCAMIEECHHQQDLEKQMIKLNQFLRT